MSLQEPVLPMPWQTSNTDLRFRISARLSKYAAHVAKHGTGYFEHQDADMAALNDIMQLIESSQAAAYKQGVTDCNTWDTWKLHANNIDTDKLDQELKNKIAAAVRAARVETVEAVIAVGRDDIGWSNVTDDKLLKILPDYYRKSTAEIRTGKKAFLDFLLATLQAKGGQE